MHGVEADKIKQPLYMHGSCLPIIGIFMCICICLRLHMYVYVSVSHLCVSMCLHVSGCACMHAHV